MPHARALAAVLTIALGGCYASHGRDGSSPPIDAGRPVDAPVRDASVRRDAPIAIDAGSLCSAGDKGVRVRVDPVATGDRRACEPTHVEGAAIIGVDPEPIEEGIRIHADYCPDRSADCRCDIIVAGVGIDVAESLRPHRDVTIDVGTNHVTITQLPTCDCLGCPCSFPLVIDARDGLLSARGTADVTYDPGDPLCDPAGECEPGRFALRVTGPRGETAQIVQGELVELGGVHVRSVRDADVFGPCAACAACGSFQASWVSWVTH